MTKLQQQIIILASLALMAAKAAPTNENDFSKSEIDEFSSDDNDGQGYRYHFKTSDGTWRQESAVFKNSDDPEIPNYKEVTGSFSYLGTDGITHVVTYTSGVNGYVETREKITAA